MPGTFAALDSGFPNLNGDGSTDNKLRAIQDYLYQLLEQLRYTLNNLSVDNFNEQEVTGWLGETITEPIKAVIADEEAHLVTLIDVTAGRILLQVSSDLADSWASGKEYKQYDIVKLTTPENPQPGEDITAVAYYQCKEGKGHTSSNANKPGTTGGAEYWESIPAGSVSSSRFAQTADEISTIVTKTGINSLGTQETLYSKISQTAEAITSEVTRATNAEGSLSSRITQTADAITSEVTRATAAEGTLRSSISQLPDEIMLDVRGEYANTWKGANSTQYYAGDVVKVKHSGDTDWTYYKCKPEKDHRGNSTNKPGEGVDWQTYWDEITQPNIQSMIDMNLNGITLAYDNSGISSGDNNASYIKLHKDGIDMGGGLIKVTNLDASTIKTGTLDAGSIILQDSFTVKKYHSGSMHDAGEMGGAYLPYQQAYGIRIVDHSGNVDILVTDLAAEMRVKVVEGQETKYARIRVLDGGSILLRATNDVGLSISKDSVRIYNAQGNSYNLLDLIT